jgi:hypothetical protein
MRSSGLSRAFAWRSLVSAAAVLLVAGCAASVDLAAPDADQAAKTFVPAEGMASIYVTRKDQFTGSAVLFQLVVDQRVIGGIAPGTYHLVPVEPGPHTVSVTTSENQSTQEVDAVAGQSYFFEIKPKMGWIAARAEVVPMNEEDGRTAVSENSLAEGITMID